MLLAEARHVRASRECGRVVDLAVGVLLHLRREAAQLAEVVERRSDGAERELRLRELVARVAIRARGNGGIIVELHPSAPLRDPLAFLPVAEKLAVGRIPDECLLLLLDALGHLFRRRLFGVVAAHALRLVLVEAVALRPFTGLEQRLLPSQPPGPGPLCSRFFTCVPG